jgi:hypothetical protein
MASLTSDFCTSEGGDEKFFLVPSERDAGAQVEPCSQPPHFEGVKVQVPQPSAVVPHAAVGGTTSARWWRLYALTRPGSSHVIHRSPVLPGPKARPTVLFLFRLCPSHHLSLPAACRSLVMAVASVFATATPTSLRAKLYRITSAHCD